MLSKRSPQLNQLFDDVLNWNSHLWPTFNTMFGTTEYNNISTLVDTYEADGKIRYCIDIPGVTKDQIKLTQEGKYLKVESERSDKPIVSKFSTTFSVSPKAKSETLEASLENGVLSIVFELKTDEEIRPEPKRIEIKDTVPKLAP